jgi:ABC-2 type transport system permease protein
MMNFLRVWRRELAACFLSPVAYVTMVVFLIMTGWTFWDMVASHEGRNVLLPALLLKSVMLLWLPVVVAVIAMRLFAEEKRSGTIETLLTAPVSETQIVLGKYAGAYTFLMMVVAPTIGFVYIFKWLSPGIDRLDTGALLGGIVILLLVSAVCMAIGLFMSLLTKNQIVAFVCCLCGIVLPFLAGWLVSLLPFGPERLVEHLSAMNHIRDFTRGSIDARPVVLYVSVTIYILFVSIRILESRRWG